LGGGGCGVPLQSSTSTIKEDGCTLWWYLKKVYCTSFMKITPDVIFLARLYPVGTESDAMLREWYLAEVCFLPAVSRGSQSTAACSVSMQPVCLLVTTRSSVFRILSGAVTSNRRHTFPAQSRVLP